MEELERKWKNGELRLFPHQFRGVETMETWLESGHGGIMADEMGLGKTCQTVVLLTRQFLQQQGPFLVVAPLSVCDHWADEIKRFSHGELEAVKYIGYETERQNISKYSLSKRSVVITAPHILIKEDALDYLLKQESALPFTTIVVDEAHSVKNQNTQLVDTLKKISEKTKPHYVLLTGTPIQNDLSELYSLLNFTDSNIFSIENKDNFVKEYKDPKKIEKLKEILKKYMLRRTKAEVFSNDLEKCEQVILYHGVSQIQKGLYKNIISKNTDAFQDKNKVIKLNNILMQLRKCVIHPYMFPGIEPEPFEEGEHLVEASGKLQVLARLLKYATAKGHRCLVFSQFLGALDIVEDFLRMRKWSYERLNGTCRSEERREKISTFQKATEGPICFLLSTKAGGVGLNLTAADTVIFLDSDWNPQNDIQAMARCHRIGQKKTVRVIRLVARYTVDQYVVAKARDKLKLTDEIMGTKDSVLQAADVVSMLRNNFGLLMESATKNFNCADNELEKLVGRTVDGCWQSLDKDKATLLLNPDECDTEDVDKNDYCNYEGVSYRDSGKSDEWDKLMEAGADENKENQKRKREYKKTEEASVSPLPKKKRKTKEEIWESKDYKTRNLPEPETAENDDHQEDTPLKYVFGDVTHPPEKYSKGKDLILHCVDNGGQFGSGGLFTAINKLDLNVAEAYEMAGKMKDLHMGDAHLLTVSMPDGPSTSSQQPTVAVVLLVAVSNRNRRHMKPEYLEMCLRRVSHFAKEEGYVVHTPRLGKSCDISWYMVDRLLKKHFSLKGIPCFVYYHPPAPKAATPEKEKEEEEPEDEKEKTVEEEAMETTPQIEKDDSPLKEEEQSVSPSTSARPRRKSVAGILEQKKEEEYKDEEESSEESSGESSASENNWSEESESEGEEEEEGDEEEEEEENSDDEEIIDSTKKKKFKNWQPDPPKPAVPHRFASVINFSDSEDDFPQRRPLRSHYHVKSVEEVVAIFSGEIVSLFGLSIDDQEEAEEIIEQYGGDFIYEEEHLHEATFAVVPETLCREGKEEELEEFKSKFDADCHFVRQEFVAHAAATGSFDDLSLFVI